MEEIRVRQAAQAAFDKMTTPETTKDNLNVQSEEMCITIKIFEKTNVENALQLFKTRYGKRSDYKVPIEDRDGSCTFTFPFPTKKENVERMILQEIRSFYTEAGIEEERYLMLDKSHQNVVGYSNGEGQWRLDGQPFAEADWLSPGIPLKEFDMSLMDEPARRLGVN